jgi:hypothetical protein
MPLGYPTQSGDGEFPAGYNHRGRLPQVRRAEFSGKSAFAKNFSRTVQASLR